MSVHTKFATVVAAAALACCVYAQTPLTVERIATGLSTRLVTVTHAPGDPDRIFLLEAWTGRIRVHNLATGTTNPAPFLSVGGLAIGSEQGLLGLAFHPDYADNGLFYVNYTEDNGAHGITRIVRYRVSPTNPDVADPGSAHPILSIVQPGPIHNAGWMGFGPDGSLYIATGDGAGPGDPGNNAQTTTNNLLGKVLRIDVDGDDFPNDPARNYAIPTDNPFVGTVGDDEIWAYGLRNPWRCAFDRLTGDLFISDVGQADREEINFQPASSTGGENYGWNCFEGNAPYARPGPNCPPAGPVVAPIHDYPIRGLPECAVMGGYVYRGRAIPDLRGAYFFGDFCANRIWSFRYDGKNLQEFTERTGELSPPGGLGGRITSFGEDARGEMYFTMLNGDVHKIVPDGPVCYPDCDGDGKLDFFDYLCFQNAFLAGDPYADCDESGRLDFFDFLCFQNEFLAGCP